jgi:hypothetical protein
MNPLADDGSDIAPVLKTDWALGISLPRVVLLLLESIK